MFLGFLRAAAVSVPRGTDPTIQILNDDVIAFTCLIDLMVLLISTAFPYLRNRRLGDAEANHADGNCQANECKSDTAQSILPEVDRPIPGHIGAPSRPYQRASGGRIAENGGIV